MRPPTAATSAFGTFVMPHFGDTPSSGEHLRLAIQSVVEQTDSNWRLVVVDDQSPSEIDRFYLESLAGQPGIDVLFNPRRLGPGPTRNRAIDFAAEAGAAFVLFLDSDDIASPDRLALTRAAFERAPADVVYSSFEPIDDESRPIATRELTPSIASILIGLSQGPPEGASAWIEMAARRGYSNLTSTTAARIELARAVRFPDERVSEDMHTWLRYGAHGGAFRYIPRSTCRYRIGDALTGSACRRRSGSSYYAEKARVDSQGLELAIQAAMTGGRLSPDAGVELRAAFRRRLAAEIDAEGEPALAQALRRLSPNEVAAPDFFARA